MVAFAMPADDFELLEAWRGGDASAGRALFERHFDIVYRFFFNKVGDATDDLLQQTFLTCVERRDAFRGESGFRTYLLGIARNKLLHHLRAQGRSRIDGPPPSIPDEFSLASAMARHDEQKLLLKGLRSLPTDLQVALELSYWEGFTDRELGELLGIPTGTVKSRLRKARQLLDDAMKRQAVSADLLRSTVDSFQAWISSIQALTKPRN